MIKCITNIPDFEVVNHKEKEKGIHGNKHPKTVLGPVFMIVQNATLGKEKKRSCTKYTSIKHIPCYDAAFIFNTFSATSTEMHKASLMCTKLFNII